MRINESDLKHYKAFKLVMNKSKIEISGESAILVGSLFDWFNKLEKRFENDLNKPPQEIKDKVEKL